MPDGRIGKKRIGKEGRETQRQRTGEGMTNTREGRTGLKMLAVHIGKKTPEVHTRIKKS
jgi:hypothetical protein